jgi:ribosomal protein S11
MIVVAGQQVSSTPALRLYAQNACAARHARITVTGPQMRQVRFSVKGRRARTVKVAPGARRVSALVALRRRGAPVQKVTTHITFRNGASPRTLVAVARRCSSGAVVPKFTG